MGTGDRSESEVSLGQNTSETMMSHAEEGAIASGLKLKKRDHAWSLSIDSFHTWLLSTNYVL